MFVLLLCVSVASVVQLHLKDASSQMDPYKQQTLAPPGRLAFVPSDTFPLLNYLGGFVNWFTDIVHAYG